MQPRNLEAARVPTRALLVGVAVIALGLGLLVYLADRPAGSAQWLPGLPGLPIRGGRPLFGAVGPWLPSFVHPFAFGLLSAAAARRRATPAYGAVAAWWAVNLAFELGQHPRLSAPISQALQSGFGPWPPAQALSRYLLNGRFDGADLLALSAGALAAAALLRLLHPRENHDAQVR
jgi:hypothetical protein